MKILAIETSCDETSAAVTKNAREVLSNIVHSQDIHSRYGGVVPELASREHVEKINQVVAAALRKASVGFGEINLVAYTASPGLAGSLLVGATAARVIAWTQNKKLAAADHIEGHALSAMLDNPGLKPPFLALVVSGGHTDLIIVKSSGDYRVVGRTRDDAAGEAFDKVAKLLGLKYPGGPEIEKLAVKGNPRAVNFPRPFMRDTWDFSFSGLKTAVLYHLRGLPPAKKNMSIKQKADVCASFQAAIVETLVDKTLRAAARFRLKKIAVGGGVAANKFFIREMARACRKAAIGFYFPSKKYCGDNAAMIALAAYHGLKRRGKKPAAR